MKAIYAIPVKPSSEPQPLLYDTKAASRLLSICPKTLWALTCPRGPIQCVRIGSRVLYSRAALESFIAYRESQQSAKMGKGGAE